MIEENKIPGVGEYEHLGSNIGSKDCNWSVRKLTIDDLIEVLRHGLADFSAMPTHLPFLLVIYPVMTFLAIRFYGDYEVLPLVFPVVAGFTLIGPLVALGMYELSRRRESGADTSRWHAFEVIHSPQILSIIVLAIILMGIYFAWLFAAWSIYNEIIGGIIPDSIDDFLYLVFESSQGLRLILVGSSLGLVFSVIVLSISLTSFPMLLDRQINPIKAIEVSINVVFENPVTMIVWGIIVSGLLILGALPALVGLSVVLPVLGHATWHLYRKAVVIDS